MSTPPVRTDWSPHSAQAYQCLCDSEGWPPHCQCPPCKRTWHLLWLLLWQLNHNKAFVLVTVYACGSRSERRESLMSLPDSDSAIKSRHILCSSADGIDMVAAYSVSGMPRCSWSMSISLMSYSLSRSVSLLSNTRFTTSGASSAFKVKISSLCAHRRTLVSALRFIPSAMLRSHRNGEKHSALSIIETRATWELSMACSAIPESLQSKLQSWTRSLTASTTCVGS